MTEHPVEPLAVSVASEGDRVVVTVVGEVDTASAGRLEAELGDALAHSDGDLALDLSGVRFLDSAGLRTLIVTQQAITREVRRCS